MNIPRMNYRQYRKARRLTHECCNYCDGNCLLLDDGEECVCVQSISYSVLCRWFQAAVLPLDAVFSQTSKLPLLSRLCQETQAPEQEAVGKETPGACVEKVMGKGPEISGLFPLVRGVGTMLLPFLLEAAFTFSTR